MTTAHLGGKAIGVMRGLGLNDEEIARRLVQAADLAAFGVPESAVMDLCKAVASGNAPRNRGGTA